MYFNIVKLKTTVKNKYLLNYELSEANSIRG